MLIAINSDDFDHRLAMKREGGQIHLCVQLAAHT